MPEQHKTSRKSSHSEMTIAELVVEARSIIDRLNKTNDEMAAALRAGAESD